MLEYLTIGTIVNVHGVRGEVKVMPDTDDVNRFRKLKSVLLNANGIRRSVDVKGVKLSNKFVILKLDGIDDRDTANLLRNVTLEVERKDAIKLPEGRYFIGDLIGCAVVEEDGNVLGTLRDVITGVSSDIYDVDIGNGKSLMIPVLENVLINVDIEKAVVTVRLLPGLKEIYM